MYKNFMQYIMGVFTVLHFKYNILFEKLSIKGVLPGEMSGKAIAKCFWHQEVEEELLAHDLREQWMFTSEKCAPMSGPTCMMMLWSLLTKSALMNCTLAALTTANKKVHLKI